MSGGDWRGFVNGVRVSEGCSTGLVCLERIGGKFVCLKSLPMHEHGSMLVEYIQTPKSFHGRISDVIHWVCSDKSTNELYTITNQLYIDCVYMRRTSHNTTPVMHGPNLNGPSRLAPSTTAQGTPNYI